MTSVEATARRRVWGDMPLVRNLTLGVGVAAAVAGMAMKYGPLPAQVERNSARLTEVEADVVALKRESSFGSCRWQDSTISQCIHHLREP